MNQPQLNGNTASSNGATNANPVLNLLKQMNREVTIGSAGARHSIRLSATFAGISDVGLGKNFLGANLQESQLSQSLVVQGIDPANQQRYGSQLAPVQRRGFFFSLEWLHSL